MKYSDPIEFLKLTQGHKQLKLQIQNYTTLLSEIDTDIDVNQNLKIISDKNIKATSLEDSSNDK